MSGLYSSLLFSFAGLVIGFIGGQLIVWRRHGSLIVPTIHVREVRSKSDLLVGVLVVILAIGTLAQGVISQQRQTECNNEFRRVLSERSDLTQQQSRESAQLQRQLIQIGSGEQADPERDQARRDYVAHMDAIDAARSKNPYPNPRC